MERMIDNNIEDEANEREIRRIRRRELSEHLPFHCGQLMRYDEIENGDVLDRRRLTGTYYCERCYTMQPTYEDVNDDAPAAPEWDDQSRLFSRYTFKVVTGRYKILDNRSNSEPRVRQIATADGEDEARVIVEALNATEQHSTLIAQRERLAQAAQSVVERLKDLPRYLEKNDSLALASITAEALADLAAAIPADVITTSEQEGRTQQ